MKEVRREDNLDRLARTLYSRKPRPRDFLGGSNAQILEDAKAEIDRLRGLLSNQACPTCGRRDIPNWPTLIGDVLAAAKRGLSKWRR